MLNSLLVLSGHSSHQLYQMLSKQYKNVPNQKWNFGTLVKWREHAKKIVFEIFVNTKSRLINIRSVKIII